MKKSIFKSLFFAGIIVVFLTSCGTQKNVLTVAKNSGVKLQYSFPDDYINYKQVQDIKQEIDAMGQLINIDINSDVDFLTRKNSVVGDDEKIDIKMNSAKMSISAMGQNMDPDLSELEGKEFHMVIAKNGKEVDTHEADAIIFQTSPEEKSNLGMMFSTIFPDLPDKPAKIGDSWASTDTIAFKDGDRFTNIVSNNHYTLNDFVDFEGKKCAEVITKYDGKITGKSFSQGMELNIKMTLTGDGKFYFDFENGILIKDNTVGKAEGTISMSMGEMEITRTMDTTTELVK
ncbi:MAG: hypothetical protein JXR31_12845 [Prolixibacteraceae bacterium]|nr:hypothetical protein [Prolixibacteraceae bacterium]